MRQIVWCANQKQDIGSEAIRFCGHCLNYIPPPRGTAISGASPDAALDVVFCSQDCCNAFQAHRTAGKAPLNRLRPLLGLASGGTASWTVSSESDSSGVKLLCAHCGKWVDLVTTVVLTMFFCSDGCRYAFQEQFELGYPPLSPVVPPKDATGVDSCEPAGPL